MFLSVSHFFNVLVFLDLTLAVLCCILLVKVSTKYAVKFVSIPIILLATYVLLIQGEDLLGRPYEMMPVGAFEFVDYRVSIQDGVKKIELWAIQDKKSRLHVIPYNEEIEQELARGKTQKQKGKRLRGEFEPGPGKGSKFIMGEIPVEEILPPKEYEEPAAPEEKKETKPEYEGLWKFKTIFERQ